MKGFAQQQSANFLGTRERLECSSQSQCFETALAREVLAADKKLNLAQPDLAKATPVFRSPLVLRAQAPPLKRRVCSNGTKTVFARMEKGQNS